MPTPVAFLIMVALFAGLAILFRNPVEESRGSAAKNGAISIAIILLIGMILQAMGCDFSDAGGDRWTL